jgi:hypothetical protein
MGAPCEIAGVVRQARLIGQKLLPRDIRRIHPMMDGCPLLHRTPDLAQLSGSSVGMRPLASIDEGSCVGWVVQDFTQSSLSGFAPDQLTGVGSSTLLSRQENTIISQTAQDWSSNCPGW